MVAIPTLFRTLPLYAMLSLDTWDECMWKVTLPLLDKLSPHEHMNALTPPSSPDSPSSAADADRPALDSSSWDASKVVALQSIVPILDAFSCRRLCTYHRSPRHGRPLLHPSETRFYLMGMPSAPRRCAVLSVRSRRRHPGRRLTPKKASDRLWRFDKRRRLKCDRPSHA